MSHSEPTVRQPVVSKDEWEHMSQAERLQRFQPAEALPTHPSLVTDERREAAGHDACSSHDDEEAIDILQALHESDYAARAANVRAALAEFQLTQAQSAMHDRGVPRRSGSILQRSSTMPSILRTSSHRVRLEPVAEGAEPAQQDRPDRRLSMSIRRNNWSGRERNRLQKKYRPEAISDAELEQSAAQAKPSLDRRGPREVLASLSLAHDKQQDQALMTKAKDKAAGWKRKIKKTFEVWRGDDI